MADGAITRPVDARTLEQNRIVADAVEAIAALGYSRADARHWVEEAHRSAPGPLSLEELTLAVLRARSPG